MFLATNILDGTSNSLLTKKYPPVLAKGILNAGLTATVAGTTGRAVGNVFISLAGANGAEHIENNLYIPTAVVTLLTVVVCLLLFKTLKYEPKKKIAWTWKNLSNRFKPKPKE